MDEGEATIGITSRGVPKRVLGGILIVFVLAYAMVDMDLDEKIVISTTVTSKSKHHDDTMMELISRHPHCFSDQLWSRSKNKKISVGDVGKYKLMARDNNDVTTTATTAFHNYDHQCPYFLKDRYNCAKNSTERGSMDHGDNPTDWELVLLTTNGNNNNNNNNNKNNTSKECNLSQLVQELGGPIGVANLMLQPSMQQQHHGMEQNDDNGSNGTTTTNIDKDGAPGGGSVKGTAKRRQPPFIVLLMGNSYLRQMFEAMACQWSTDITDYRVAVNATRCVNLQPNQTCTERAGELVPPKRENVEGNSVKRQRDKQAFYRPGVTLPRRVFADPIRDDVAMVEFGNRIRFYYIFRPYEHKHLADVFTQSFHLDLASVDKLVFNYHEDERLAENNTKLQRMFQSTVWQTRSVWPYLTFKQLQERDIGRWFGADNPWVYFIPEGHACLPGVPDDEANLLLFSILSNASVGK